MNSKLTITANLLAATLLTGCGGGGGGGGGSTPAPVAYFNVSFVRLQAVEADTNTSCQNFGFSEDLQEKAIGYRATADSETSRFSIVIHNADGSVVNTYSSEQIGASSTSYRFRQSAVPSDGFVSFVVKSELGSYRATTFAKNLLPSSFQLGLRSSLASSTCIASTSTAEVTRSAYINDSDYRNDYYGFNTYNQDLTSIDSHYYVGGFRSEGELDLASLTGKQVFAVRYANSLSDGNRGELGTLQSFKLLSLSDIRTGSSNQILLDDVEDSGRTWTAPTDSNISLSQANMFVYRTGTGALMWQPMSTSASTSAYSYDSSIGDSNYYVNLTGSLNSWSMSHTENVTTPSADHDSSTTITELNLPSASEPVLYNCGSASSAGGQCLTIPDNSVSQDDTIVRIARYFGTDAIHTVYANYGTDVPVMSFDDLNETLQDFLLGAADNAEISLFKADSEQNYDSFKYGHSGAYAIAGLETSTTSYSDPVTLLSSVQQQEAYQDELKYQPNTWLSASF